MMLVAQTISDQKILSLPYGQPGPSPCTRTCSGVSSYKETGTYRWRSDYYGKAYKIADTTECGFVSAPVVTAILKGRYTSLYCPPIQALDFSNTSFYFMTFEDTTPSNMVRIGCDVYWIATGYTC